MKMPAQDIRKLARRLALPVYQHHIAVNGADRISIRIACLRRAGVSFLHAVQAVRLGSRVYMVFSYDPQRLERGHIRRSWGKENALMFYSATSARVLRSFATGRTDDARFRFLGRPKTFADKDGVPVTVVWRVSESPVRDIAHISRSGYDGKKP